MDIATWNSNTLAVLHNSHYDSRCTLTLIVSSYILMSVSPCFQLGSRFLGFHTDTFSFKLAAFSLFESTRQ